MANNFSTSYFPGERVSPMPTSDIEIAEWPSCSHSRSLSSITSVQSSPFVAVAWNYHTDLPHYIYSTITILQPNTESCVDESVVDVLKGW